MLKNVLLIAAFLSAATISPAGNLSSIVGGLSSDDFELRQESRLELRQMLADADAEELNELELGLVDLLDGDTPQPSRVWMVRMLELFGSKISVPFLESLLDDPDREIRDCARRALIGIPDPEATRALERQLEAVSGEDKAPLLDALGYRGDPSSVSIMADYLYSKSPVIFAAAAAALGNTGGPEAVSSLVSRHGSADGSSKVELEFALINSGLSRESADALAREGQNGAIRTAAFQALLKEDTAEAAKVLGITLGDPDYPGRAAIIRNALANGLSGVVMELLPELELQDQLLVLGAISDRELGQFEPNVLDLLKTATDDELSEACIQTLGIIGGDSSFDPLYAIYLENSENEVVADALSWLRTPSADSSLLSNAADNSDPVKQKAALELLALRNTPGVLELVNRYAVSGNPGDLRQAAFNALERIGDMHSVHIFLGIITSGDALSREAQRSLKRLSSSMGIPEYQWEEAYKPAIENAPDEAGRKAILAILDGIPCESSADFLDELITGESPLRADALRSLARWSDVSAGEIWIKLASSEDASAADKRSALRGINRILTNNAVKGSSDKKIDLAVEAIRNAPDSRFKQSIIRCYISEDGEVEDVTDASERIIKKVFPDLVDDPVIGNDVQAILDSFES